MNYERLVQWIAGPSSAIVGFLTMKLANAGIFGSLGLGTSGISHALVDGLTFLGGAVATYAAHHKWLSNLAQWWEHSSAAVIAEAEAATAAAVPDTVPPESAATPDPPPADTPAAAA